jgi:adenylate kinase
MSSLFVMLGAPGAGKGTQAKRLSELLDLPHISSGDLFRENLAAKTELGRAAEGFLTRGELVPDDVTIGMIRERLSRPDCARGGLLDGFPRTIPQAVALEALGNELGASVRKVIYVKAREAVLVDRLSGRWICKAGGHLYHERFNPPKRSGRCDVDGSPLYQRDDDKAETVAKRIRVYLQQTAPLIEHYRGKGLLVEADGELPIEELSAGLQALLSSESIR